MYKIYTYIYNTYTIYIYIYIYIYIFIYIYISKMRHLFQNKLYFGFFPFFEDSIA